MNAIMRKSARAAATGLGALALVLGASACGNLLGGDEGEGTTTEEQPAEEGEDAGEDAAEAPEDGAEDAAASDEGGEDSAAAGPIAEEELTAAGDRFYEYLQALNEHDADTVCSMMIDPTTGSPAEGAFLDGCVSGFENEAGEAYPAGSLDSIQREMVEATDNGDGTVGIALAGSEFPMSMAQVDGEWYVDTGI